MVLSRIALFLFFVSPLAAARAEICQLNPAAAPNEITYQDAVVVGLASDAGVLEQSRVAIFRVRAPVSPAYIDRPRIIALFRDSQGAMHRTIAAVLSGPLPAPHSNVTLASRHRDPNQPCAFIPWTVAKPGDAA